MWAFCFCKNIVAYKYEHLPKAQAELKYQHDKPQTFNMSRNLFASEKLTLIILS